MPSLRAVRMAVRVEGPLLATAPLTYRGGLTSSDHTVGLHCATSGCHGDPTVLRYARASG